MRRHQIDVEASNVTILSRNFADWLEIERNVGDGNDYLRKKKHLKMFIRLGMVVMKEKTLKMKKPGDKRKTPK